MNAPQTLTSIAEYSATAAGLADIRQRLANVVFDVQTPAGMEEARKSRRELVSLRVALEEKRVELKAPALERSRLIDAEAKRIDREIRTIEEPISEQIRSEEARKQAEKEERERQERNRIAEIRGRIDQMARLPLLLTGTSAAKLKDARAKLADMVLPDVAYAEFLDEALRVRAGVLEQLDAAIPKQEAQEAEQARLKAEREELERQRVEQQRVEAEQRARTVEEDRQRRAKLEQDELAAKAARDKADQEAAATRKAEQDRLNEEARIAREKREQEEREAKSKRDEEDRVARKAREAADRQAADARAAAQKKLDDEAATVLKQKREQEEAAAKAERDRRAAEEMAVEESLALFESNPVMQAIIKRALDFRIADHGPAARAALVLLCEDVTKAIAAAKARPKREKAAA
jgi:colicin import membrane protein